MTSLEYTHVDVFDPVPFSGNSLPVFVDAPDLYTWQMLRVTQELRHFEAIFFQRTADPAAWRARIFDLSEELPFAGHPVLGAAAVLHRAAATPEPRTWQIELASKTVIVTTESSEHGYQGVLDQGAPEFLGTVRDRDVVARAFDLDAEDLREDLPLEVVSTGLRYLIVPVRPAVLGRARLVADITALVRSVGADFAVLLDESSVEIRHWNNDGVVEDIATGSAAGTIGAYRLRHALVAGGQAFALRQGRFAGRPSVLTVRPQGTSDRVETVLVGGPIAIVGHGIVDVPR